MDGGDQLEYGNQLDSESDPKLFSASSYDHPGKTDDADVAEDEKDEKLMTQMLP